MGGKDHRVLLRFTSTSDNMIDGGNFVHLPLSTLGKFEQLRNLMTVDD